MNPLDLFAVHDDEAAGGQRDASICSAENFSLWIDGAREGKNNTAWTHA
jgi:hypothetical protein